MKNMKKAFIIPLLLASFLASCNAQGNGGATSSEEASQQTGDSLTLGVYEAVSVPEKYGSAKGTVKDESVAKLVGGKIIGLSAGETSISFEGHSSTLSVKVNETGDVPFLSLGQSSLSLFEGSSYTLSPSLTYKGKAVEAAFSYTLSDSGVANVSSSGVISALGQGTASLTVTASYYGLEADNHPFLAASLSLYVYKASSALLSASSTSLYTLTCTLDGKEFSSEATLSGSYGDDKGVSDLFKKQLTWVVSDPTVLSISGTKVKALKKGKAEVYATFEGGETNHLSFVVDKPYYEVGAEGFYDSYNKSLDLDFSSIWKGSDSKAIAIYDDAEPDANILSSDGSLNFSKLGERNWTIEGASYNYKVRVTSVSKVITTSTELTSLLLYGSNKKMSDYGYMSMEAYFVLGADIDMKGAYLRAILGPKTGASVIDSSGFIGTFDGRGHSIKNAVIGADGGGLFGTLAVNSAIKNLALVDCEVKGSSGALTSYLGGSIENVYVRGKISYAKGTSSLYSSLLGNRIDSHCSVNNVVVEYTNASANTPFASALGYFDGDASENNFSNVYVIGTSKRVYATAKKDSYISFSHARNGCYEDYASFKEGADLSSFSSNWSFGNDGISFHQ